MLTDHSTLKRPTLVTGKPIIRRCFRHCLKADRAESPFMVVNLFSRFYFIAFYTESVNWVSVFEGIGIWGLNNPVGWGYAIVNFVFWVGIGHAGTLISAILFLFRQKWRTGINRFAEAMTIFLRFMLRLNFSRVFHIGRQWMAYFLFPIPKLYGYVA